MPRGFLVKRIKTDPSVTTTSWRRRDASLDSPGGSASAGSPGASDGEPSDPASDLTTPLPLLVGSYPSHDSPDSGFSQSPGLAAVNLCVKDKARHDEGGPPHHTERPPSPAPRTVPPSNDFRRHDHLMTSYPLLPYTAPFHYSAFTRLAVTSPRAAPPHASPLTGLTHHVTSPLPGAFSPFLPPATAAMMSGRLRHPAGPILSPHRGLQAFSAPTSTNLHPAVPTPSPSKKRSSPTSPESPPSKLARTPKKPKAARKIQFDENTSSPVSGTIIREASEDEEGIKVCSGDIDSKYNVVEVTAEARAELAKIDNKLGAYVCQLCRERYDDAFQLAQHRCPRIVHVEYRCPECDKVFNCPANLASHRRWHKPRQNTKTSAPPPRSSNGSAESSTAMTSGPRDHPLNHGMPLNHRDVISPSDSEDARTTPSPSSDVTNTYQCQICRKRFKRESYLRKHMATHSAGPVPPHTAPQSHPTPDSPIFPCHFCSKVLKTEVSRTKHILQLHTPGLGQTGPSQHTSGPSQHSPSDLSTGPKQLSSTSHVSPPKLSPTDLTKHDARLISETFPCHLCKTVFYNASALTHHVHKCRASQAALRLHLGPTRLTTASPHLTPATPRVC